MKMLKPKFWDQKNIGFFSIILYPLSLLLLLIISLKKVFTKVHNFKIPIICVGNIYLGGTGKTPLSILIAQEMLLIKKKPVIVKKFYKNHLDEHNLIKKYFKSLILEKNRLLGVQKASRLNFDTIILDDGFQDTKIKKQLNIICFNEKQLVGNGLVFPSGPLRESLNSIKRAEIVVINGEKKEEFENDILRINPELSIFYSEYRIDNLEKLKNERLLAFAGIGNPSNFFDLLKKNNLNVVNQLTYPDHYEFSKKELKKIIDMGEKNRCKIVLTEKDFLRIKNYDLNKFHCVNIKLYIRNKDKFIERLTKIYD